MDRDELNHLVRNAVVSMEGIIREFERISKELKEVSRKFADFYEAHKQLFEGDEDN